MATYPLTAPTTQAPVSVDIKPLSAVGMSRSPASFSQQIYAHQGQLWQMSLTFPRMSRAVAEELIGVLVALNGMEGTLLCGVPGCEYPLGTWGGAAAVLVNGASQQGNSLTVDGTEGKTVGVGDYFQLGTGSGTHLHKVVVQGRTGDGAIDIWPRLRSSPADNAPLVVNNPIGLWRLASNEQHWSIGLATRYGLTVDLIEAL